MLTQLQTIPDSSITEYVTKIAFDSLSTPQHTFSTLIVGIPPNYVVCGTNIRLLTMFSGAGLTSMTVSLAAFVPNSILSDLLYYGLEAELTQVVTPQAFQLSGPPNNNLTLGATQTFAPASGLYFNGAHDVAAYFTSVGTTLDNLSAGVVEITVQIRPF
jgi:hypothetical protein